MPNWCYNRVNVYGDSDTVDQVKEIYEIFENHSDPFNQILPILISRTSLTTKGNYPSLNNTRMIRGRLFGKHTIFQMVRMMIDGITGALQTGVRSGIVVNSTQNMRMMKYWNSLLVLRGVHPKGIMQELKDKYPDLGFSCFYDEPGMEIAGYYQDSLESVHLGLHS